MDRQKNWNQQYGYVQYPIISPYKSQPMPPAPIKTSTDIGVGGGTFCKKKCGIVRK